MLLLMSDDFSLTSIEKHELMFYGSRFQSFAKKGGRGKTREKVYACLCIYLLQRDKRPIYTNDREYYNHKYGLNKKDVPQVKEFILKEIRRIHKRATIDFIWG
jgi:hypothetical protein